MTWRPSRFHPTLATALAAGTAAALWYTLAPAGLPTLDIDGQRLAYSGWLAATFATATIALALAACSSWMLWAASATVPARKRAAPMLWRCAACATAGVLAVGPVIAAGRAWLVGDWIPVGPAVIAAFVVGYPCGHILRHQRERIGTLRRRDALAHWRQDRQKTTDTTCPA